MSQDAGFRYFICLILNTTVGTYVRRMKTKLLPHQHVHSTAVRLKTAGSAKLLIFVKKKESYGEACSFLHRWHQQGRFYLVWTSVNIQQ
jgi:hypothetical protein